MGNSDRRKIFESVLKMDITSWLSLVLAVLTFATPASSTEPRVVCYYTNWSVYRPGTARFNPQNINPYLCTHLIYAFGGFTKDNTLKPFDKYQDIEKGGYAKFTGLKTYNKNLKTLLAVGGWNEGSSRFSPMVAARDRRKDFVRNAIKFLRQNRFDGLDLDWEYPAFRDGGKPKDRENYAKLVKELREEFEKEAEKTRKPRLLLTMAVPAGIEYIQKGFDVKTLNKYLDWMNLLTYDYHSAFEPAVNHHAPLFPLEEPNEYSVDNELNIDYTIKFYLENGADQDKLVLGIPTYGRSYTLFNPDAIEIGSPADGPGEQGEATREKGYLAYYEICEALKSKTKKRSTSDEDSEEDSEEEEEEEPWTVMYPNPDAMGPVAFKGNQWVGYDDIEIVRKKAEYVAENGLGGIMFWSIDNDDFRGNCHEKPYPLIEAAKESYIAKLGSTNNVIVSERPTAAASSSKNRKKRPRITTTTTTTTVKPSAAAKVQGNKRKSGSSLTSTTPAWNIITPEPPTTPDPGADFKCKDEGFFQHPRDCKKYFWCLDSGPSNLGIVAHQFTCPSGLFFNKAADSCDFARNVLCKTSSATTKAPTTKAIVTTSTTTTRKPIKLSTKSSLLFRTTTTTTTTPEPESEEEYEEEIDSADLDAEDPKVIKELIDLIKKVGGVEQLEKHLHLAESSTGQQSTDGAVTTTASPFSKKLYQKVLERTRGKNKFPNNNFVSKLALNSRRGPQNEGLEASSDKDKLFRKDRPQYTTINRARPSTTTTTEEPEIADEIEDEPILQPQPLSRARAVETPSKLGTTAKPLQYVNIRRARPTTTSDTADDTASRNALFERSESYVTVTEAPNSLDVVSARRENVPEYVTIRRQRPNSEESTTAQYQSPEPEELQETALEKEISQSSQPQYTSIVRARSTTIPPSEEPSSPEPTTVLAVQISSFLNSPTSVEAESPKPETAAPAEAVEPTTTLSTTSTTTTITTTTAAPSSLPTRRTVLRRRGPTSTTTPAPSSTTQVAKDRWNAFQRRTKATAPPDTTETETEPINTIETTTNKFTRRGNSKFKPRKGAKDAVEHGNDEAGRKEEKFENRTRRPSFGGSAARNERPTRNFVRRRLGGANATTTVKPASGITGSAIALPSRRPFRVASRRRPSSTTATSTTTSTTTQATTVGLASEESLQDIGDTDDIEDLLLRPRVAPKTPKVQRRPLVSLKDEAFKDQNPSATNEEEKKRQSKKYSSTFKQNQLDEVLKKAKSQEEVDTTTEGRTTIEEYSPETAVAIAAHQLLAAPIPSTLNFEEQTKPTKKSVPTTTEYRYTKTDYTQEYTTNSKNPIYSEEFTSTPTYKTTNTEYIQTSTGGFPSSFTKSTDYNPETTDFSRTTAGFSLDSTAFTKSTAGYSPESAAFTKSTAGFSPESTDFTNSNAGFNSDSSVFTKTTAEFNPESTVFTKSTPGYSREPTSFSKSTANYSPESTAFIRSTARYSPEPTGFTRSSYNPESSTFTSSFTSTVSRPFSTTLINRPSRLNPEISVSPGIGLSTAKYLGSSDKYTGVPIEDYGYSTSGYTGSSQDPSYFTREYLLESPVTKTYDDKYQYLSPVTKPQTTTRKAPHKKTVQRKISTTIRPTTSAYEVPGTTPKPRRIPPKKPFEKIPAQKPAPNRTYRPIENYDYYDDGEEKVVEKYAEETKVVLHGKGAIECLDIGNFPHPISCKKFISCARIENGSLLGWEYICPKGLSFDPVGGICNWSAGLGCNEKDF